VHPPLTILGYFFLQEREGTCHENLEAGCLRSYVVCMSMH
jgi:hypothetical protein